LNFPANNKYKTINELYVIQIFFAKKKLFIKCAGITKAIGLTRWRRFVNAIDKAKEVCIHAGEKVADYLAGIGKVIEAGKGAMHKIEILLELAKK
jgi:hypothetical protein